MKKLIFIPTLLLFLFSTTMYAQSKFVINPNGDKDQAVVKGFMEAMRSGDPSQLGKHHSDSYIGYGPRWESPETKEDMKQHMQSIWDRMEDIRHERIRMISVSVTEDEMSELNGDWVFTWGVFVAKDKSSGKEISLDTHQAFKIENGVIVLSTVYYNQLDYLVQTDQYPGN